MSSPSRAACPRSRAGGAIQLLLCGSFLQPAATEAATPAGNTPKPEVRASSRHDTTALLRDMPLIPPRAARAVMKPPRRLPNRIGGRGIPGDGALQQGAAATITAPVVGASFEGIANVDGVLPPDTNGDIGPNHYVQTVNLSFGVWDRSGSTLYGPADINTLWQGFGGPCETSNDGDPIALYDQLADRWLMSQFALPNFPSGPFYQCVAVSQSGDPTGAWHRYEFKIHDSKLNDYPKFGVWPDGYYMAINQFTCNFFSCSWAGQGTVVFERDRMLSGQSARMTYFDLFNTDANLGGMLPSDLDGPVPPAGAPNPFVLFDDDAWGYSPDQLQVWNFHTDWTNTANTTFTFNKALGTAAFDSDMCGYSRNCIPQKDTSVKVDAISDRLMFRLQYRNFGTHEILLSNHSVDANGSDRAGVRWYELRNTGSGWAIHQQGTFSPDGNHRWMGSAAMNGIGDIALGYSVSSGTVFPSIRATGRFAEDAAGQMTQGDVALMNGTGHQTHSSGRWGDYSMMAADPVDDCTFWYTQEYYAVKGSAPWQTRIASFKLRDCAPQCNTDADCPDDGNACTDAVCTDGQCGQVNNTATCDDGNACTSSDTCSAGACTGTTVDCNDSNACTTDGCDPASGSCTHTALACDDSDACTADSCDSAIGCVFTPIAGCASTMHVGDLDGSKSAQGGSWTARVTITVHDSGHNPVGSANVSGSWSNGATGSSSCITNSSGQCSVSKASIPRRTGSVRFTVGNVTHASLTYESSANHDPDGDSDGTRITVTKP